MANQTDQSPGSSRDNGRLAIVTSDYKPEYRSEDGADHFWGCSFVLSLSLCRSFSPGVAQGGYFIPPSPDKKRVDERPHLALGPISWRKISFTLKTPQ